MRLRDIVSIVVSKGDGAMLTERSSFPGVIDNNDAMVMETAF